MPLMRSPDGEIADVAPEDMEHYQGLGAVPAGPEARIQQGAKGPTNPLVRGGLIAAGAAADAASTVSRVPFVKEAAIGMGAALGTKKLMSMGKTRAGSPRRGGDKLPASLVAVTKEDIAKHPELKNYKAGEPIRRARMEQIKMGPPPKSGGPEIPESAAKRIEAGKTPTRPIEIVEGNQRTPARAPAQTKEPPYTGGRGASLPELGRRAAAMERYTTPATIPPVGDDLESQLRGSSALNELTKKAGLTSAEATTVRGRGAAMVRSASNPGSVGGGLLALLPMLLGSQDIPQQMDEARQIGFDSSHPNISPALKRALLEELAGL